MKHCIAEALRSMADTLDPPPPPPVINLNRTFRIDPPVFSPEVAARIGKQMAALMKASRRTGL